MFSLNRKGQAASVDALIFLSIISIVFVMILGYSMNYGLNIMDGAKKLYTNNYHYTALKSFMNASYGRDANDLLTTKISDSVATMIKEDYGANSWRYKDELISDPAVAKPKLISVETKISMFNVLDELFLPLPQRSYILLITHNASDIDASPILVPLVVLIKTINTNDTANDDVKVKYYSCYFDQTKSVEDYLQIHPLDLELVEGNFILYRNVLSKEEDIRKENGSIFLGSWITGPENFDFEDCEDYTDKIIVSTN